MQDDPTPIQTTAEAVRRVQEWLGDERESGRCALELKDAWISRLLEAANGKA